MTKFFSAILSLILLALGAVLFASPAQASEIGNNVTLCQAQGNGGYHLINPAKNSLVTGNGSISGINANDIVPPFDWNFGGNNHGSYPGQNWVPVTSETFFANGCSPNTNVLTPNLPSATVQATCMDPTAAGIIQTPEQPSGVAISAPVLSNNAYEFTFSKTVENTVYETYDFAQGFAKTVLVRILPPLTTDPYWDAKKGECNLPDTGAGGISNTALMFGGGAIGLGLIFVSISSTMKRRETK
jgi:hypothetical protein